MSMLSGERSANGLRTSLALAFAVLALLASGQAQARWIDLGGEPVEVRLVESDGSRSLIEITIGGFEAEAIDIDGGAYHHISLDREAEFKEIGLPELPRVRRSIIIPDDARMAVRLIDSEYVDLPGMPVAPSKGNLSRAIDPATVPYTFDAFYGGGLPFPDAQLEGGKAYIMRDFRGMVVDARPFRYDPSDETLRVYTRMLFEVAPIGKAEVNVLERGSRVATYDGEFARIYENHFLNFTRDRYTPVTEDGGLLIITYDAFMSSIMPLYEWKLQKGIDARIVTLSEVGGTATQIADYIQDEYDTWNLAYVLLVGDAEQMPMPSSDADPVYSLVAGADNYPDLFIGRFSAENASQVSTQVARTITYERDAVPGEAWPQYGTGVASNEGPGHNGEYDNQHSDLIRDDLLAYGYLGVDQIYQPSATSAMVTSALNEGRGIVNYTGHGSQTAWSTSGFSNTHVNALVNDDMLPFICSVACNNGTFTGATCFAEAWLRATNGGVPTGAVACYMSYISQSWDPPMYGQDEAVDLLVADAMRSIGGLWFNGSCHMNDMAGASGENEFRNWMIFGDPSLAVRTKAATSMTVNHAGVLFIGVDTYDVGVPGVPDALCALYADGILYGTAVTDAGGNASITIADPPGAPVTLTLTVTAYNKATVAETVEVLPPSGSFLVFEAVAVQDAGGDADGLIDEGETAGLEVTLKNVGVDPASGVSAQLACTDPHITIVEGIRAYPDIPADGLEAGVEPFVIEVAGDIPDEHPVTFTIAVTANEGGWDSGFVLTAQAPVLVAYGCLVGDTNGGDGNGTANAGETVTLFLRLGNEGHSAAEDLSGLLSCSAPEISVLDNTGTCPDVPVGGTVEMARFTIELDPGCPEPAHIDLDLDISALNGFGADLLFDLPVGGWYDDMDVDRGWTVGAPGDDASSGQWVAVDPIGTEYGGGPVQPEDDHTADPGTHCYITGQHTAGQSAGFADVDGGKTTLLSPVFNLDGMTTATVGYWRWYTNDQGNNPGADWWDVDVTNDGVNWVSLEHTQDSAESWLYFEFELTDFVSLTDNVQLRFVAADDSPGSLVEAGVDDFLLTTTGSVETGVEDDGALPKALSMAPNFPNPFNPQTTIRFALPRSGEVDLAVIDLAGRRVATLVDGPLPAGQHRVTWNGRDDAGRRVSSGIYFSKVSFGGEVRSSKMIMLK